MPLAYRFTFERKCTGNESLPIFFCTDLKCKTYGLHRYRVMKLDSKLGVANLADFGFQGGQSSCAFDQCAQYPNPRLYDSISTAGWSKNMDHLRRSLPSESRSSPRAYDSCSA